MLDIGTGHSGSSRIELLQVLPHGRPQRGEQIEGLPAVVRLDARLPTAANQGGGTTSRQQQPLIREYMFAAYPQSDKHKYIGSKETQPEQETIQPFKWSTQKSSELGSAKGQPAE